MDPHRIGELRSLAYHRAVVARLDAEHLARARARALAWARSEARWARLAERWLELLDGPRDALVAAMTKDSEAGAELRSASPFAGTLTPRERWALWRRVREEAEA